MIAVKTFLPLKKVLNIDSNEDSDDLKEGDFGVFYNTFIGEFAPYFCFKPYTNNIGEETIYLCPCDVVPWETDSFTVTVTENNNSQDIECYYELYIENFNDFANIKKLKSFINYSKLYLVINDNEIFLDSQTFNDLPYLIRTDTNLITKYSHLYNSSISPDLGHLYIVEDNLENTLIGVVHFDLKNKITHDIVSGNLSVSGNIDIAVKKYPY